MPSRFDPVRGRAAKVVEGGRDRLRTYAQALGGFLQNKRPWWIAALAGVLCLFAVGGVAFWSLMPSCSGEGCPSLDDLEGYRPPEPPHVFDRHGDLAGHLPGRLRMSLGLEQIPTLLRNAYVAVEDRRFWEHGGVDVRSALRAFKRNVSSGETVEGASTITMQLARNIFAEDVLRLSRWHRKATEVRLALGIESRLTKREILELYLNQIYLGDGVYGVGAAARHYFDKEVDELSVAETALIVGLTKNPEGYNPRRFPERALDRREVVLDVMAREGVVEPARARVATAEPLDVAETSLVWDRGSYYAMAVRRELIDIFPDPAQRDGVRVFTGLDRGLQAASEEALAWQIARIEAGELGEFRHPLPEDTAPSTRADASPYLQGMAVALDASTGVVRALVGGRDFSRSEFDRAFLARRQPGSAFKPFILAAALSENVPLTELVSVDSLAVPTPDSEEEEDSVWHLADYDPDPEVDDPSTVTLRSALVQSSNVAAVRIGMEVGIDQVIQKAHQLGIRTGIPRYPALFLGSAEVIPAELVAAFAPFENGGNRVTPHLVTRIESSDGEVLWEAAPPSEPVLDPRVAFITRDVLQDVVNQGTGWRVRAEGLRGLAAGKTGTTNDGRDVWFVGMRPGIVAGVWLGFDQPRSIVPGATGGELAAPVWARFMATLPDSALDDQRWARPSGVTTARVDGSTGFLANESCPEEHVHTEYFLPGTQPRETCPIHGRNFFDRIVTEIRNVFSGDSDGADGGSADEDRGGPDARDAAAGAGEPSPSASPQDGESSPGDGAIAPRGGVIVPGDDRTPPGPGFLERVEPLVQESNRGN